MNIHISVNNQNARVFLRKLPKREPAIKQPLKTSTGIVKNQTIGNGKKVINHKEIEKLSYKILNLENPEIDINKAGKILVNDELTSAYHKKNDFKIANKFNKFKVSLNLNNEITEKITEEIIHTNINELSPLIINLEKTIPIQQAFSRFAFKDVHQLVHKDKDTMKILMDLAKTLQNKNSCALINNGENGMEPLILQENGKPCRGFIFGKIKENKYKLLVMFTDMEFKTITQIEEIQKNSKLNY